MDGKVIEGIIGWVILLTVIFAIGWMVVVSFGGESEPDYDRTSTHCEVEEGYMGQQVVVCEGD